LLYPDEDTTYSLATQSPFKYVPKKVTIRRLARNGKVESERSETRVIVEGLSAPAQTTIDVFKLNGASYDQSAATFEISFAERMTFDDERISQRTVAYARATAAAEALVGEDLEDVAPSLMRQLAGTTGFWSVWATVLYDKTGDRNRVLNVLAPETTQPVEPWIGPTPERPFPGTKRTVL
jgi:hypothetical protein